MLLIVDMLGLSQGAMSDDISKHFIKICKVFNKQYYLSVKQHMIIKLFKLLVLIFMQ